MSNFPHIFLCSQSALSMVTYGRSLEMPKPLAIFTFWQCLAALAEEGSLEAGNVVAVLGGKNILKIMLI